MKTVIDALVAENAPFACWANGEEVQAIIDTEVQTLPDMAALNHCRGFVFAPFECREQTPIVLLRPTVHLKNSAEIKRFAETVSSQTYPTTERELCSQSATDFCHYQTYVNKTIAHLQQENPQPLLRKVVLSKTSDNPRGEKTLGQLFLALKNANPRAFVYLVNVPTVGLWLGATPETLLHSDGERAMVMSLAGTQPLRDDHDYRWRTKEIEEQAFVSRYTVDTLNRYGVQNYQTTGPEDCETSAVVHLKTTFSFSLESIRGRLGEFVADLSPTPAVCGLPKETAKVWIAEHEPHDRAYYTGFLGAWRLHQDEVDLFVNIRCLQVFEKHYRLYTGGGITAKSAVHAEWQETERKANTLLSVIRD